MTRCTSYIGLTKKAMKYINKRILLGSLVDVSSKITWHPESIDGHYTYYRDVFGFEYGLANDDAENRRNVFPLRVFHDLYRNRLIYECIETSPWMGGPNVMTFLKDEFGNIVKCSSWGHFERGEYRFYEDDDWVSSGDANYYKNAKFVGRNKSKKTRVIVY